MLWHSILRLPFRFLSLFPSFFILKKFVFKSVIIPFCLTLVTCDFVRYKHWLFQWCSPLGLILITCYLLPVHIALHFFSIFADRWIVSVGRGFLWTVGVAERTWGDGVGHCPHCRWQGAPIIFDESPRCFDCSQNVSVILGYNYRFFGQES